MEGGLPLRRETGAADLSLSVLPQSAEPVPKPQAVRRHTAAGHVQIPVGGAVLLRFQNHQLPGGDQRLLKLCKELPAVAHLVDDFLPEPLRGFVDHLAHVLRMGAEDDVLAVCLRHVPRKALIHPLRLFKGAPQGVQKLLALIPHGLAFGLPDAGFVFVQLALTGNQRKDIFRRVQDVTHDLISEAKRMSKVTVVSF